jgi:hypothetical protein
VDGAVRPEVLGAAELLSRRRKGAGR